MLYDETKSRSFIVNIFRADLPEQACDFSRGLLTCFWSVTIYGTGSEVRDGIRYRHTS